MFATTFKHLYILSFIKGLLLLIKISEITRDPGMLAVWGGAREWASRFSHRQRSKSARESRRGPVREHVCVCVHVRARVCVCVCVSVGNLSASQRCDRVVVGSQGPPRTSTV